MRTIATILNVGVLMEWTRLPGHGLAGPGRGSGLVCVSIPGRSLPLRSLEALSFPRAELGSALPDLRARAGAREVCVISTCERVEVYATGLDGAASALAEALAGSRGVPPGAVHEVAHLYAGRAAAHHLLRVTSGLESFVLGERDIVGQVRAAAEASRGAGVLGLELERLTATAVNTSRRVHRSTSLGEAGRSVAGTAVRTVALENDGDLTGRRVLVVGAGDVATEVTAGAAALGAEVTVCNRTRRKAERWVAAGATVLDLGRLPEPLATADVAIFATAAPEPLVSAAELADARAGAERPLVVLDLCVPRNVAPEVRDLPGVRLLDLADLRSGHDTASEAVTRDVATAERIVAEELDRHLRWLARRAAAPAVRRLRDDLDACARVQVEQATRGVAEEVRPVVEERVRRAVGQLAHRATQRLLEAAEAGDDELVDTLSGMYAAAGPDAIRA